MTRIGYRFDVFLRCGCGRTAWFVATQNPQLFPAQRFRCTACGARDPEIVVRAIWQRMFRPKDWTPFPDQVSHGRGPSAPHKMPRRPEPQ